MPWPCAPPSMHVGDAASCRHQPAISTPWRASTCMSNLRLWPTFSTASIRQQRLQLRQHRVARQLRWRHRIGLAAAEIEPALLFLSGAHRSRRHMPDRDVATDTRLDRHRHADQIGAHGIERRGFRVDGDDPGRVRRRDPAIERRHIQHQLVLRDRAFVFFRRRAAGAGLDASVCAVAGSRRAQQARRRSGSADELPAASQHARSPCGSPGRAGSATAPPVPASWRTRSSSGVGDLHAVIEQNQPPADARQLRVLDQRLTPLRLLDLAGTLQQRFEIAIGVDELGCGLRRRCRARPARCRWNRPPAPARPRPGPARRRISRAPRHRRSACSSSGRASDMPRPHQLHQILVGGDDGHLGAGLAPPAFA